MWTCSPDTQGAQYHLTGGYKVCLKHYVGEGTHHLEIRNAEDQVTGWCVTKTWSPSVFEAIKKLIAHRLKLGDGPRDLAALFDSVRHGELDVGSTVTPRVLDRFDFIEDFE